MRPQSTNQFGTNYPVISAAKQVAGKCVFGASGVKTPEENADFTSCLNARPTKLTSFSVTREGGRYQGQSFFIWFRRILFPDLPEVNGPAVNLWREFGQQ